MSSYAVFLFEQNESLYATFNYSVLIIFYLIVTFTMSFGITPTTFIAVISGYFFSWQGFIGVVISYCFASLISLYLGKFINRFTLKELINTEKFTDYVGKISSYQFLTIIFIRLSPILPFAVSSFAVALMRPDIKKYLLATLIGMLPRTFIFFYIGMNIFDVWNFINNPTSDGFTKLLPILLILLSSFGLFIILKKVVNNLRD